MTDQTAIEIVDPLAIAPQAEQLGSPPFAATLEDAENLPQFQPFLLLAKATQTIRHGGRVGVEARIPSSASDDIAETIFVWISGGEGAEPAQLEQAATKLCSEPFTVRRIGSGFYSRLSELTTN